MSPPLREQRVAETFVALTDTLVSDYDVLDLMATLVERAVELLEVTAAAVLLVDSCTEGPGGPRGLSVAAASSDGVRWFETFGVELSSGPGVDCVGTGRAVAVADLAGPAGRHRWPRFARAAGEAGFRAVHALPLRHGDTTVGTLTLLHTRPHLLDDPDRRLGQAPADATTVGLLHRRAVRDAEAVSAELRATLENRIVVDQASGLLAGRWALAPDEAFAVIRRWADSRELHLVAVCHDLVAGRLDPSTVGRPAR